MSEKRIALYSRVSTEIQVERDSLVNQEDQLLSYARRTDLSFDLYRDAGVSAKNTERPAFRRMMEDVRSARISSVVVTKLDRISRNLKDLAILLDELRDREVDFICITQGIDTSSPTGRLIYQVLGGLGEWEREMTAERVAEAMRVRAKRKLWNGGPTPFGYSHNAEDKTLVLNEQEAPIARKIFETFLEIGTFRGTADRMSRQGYRTRSGCYWAAQSIKRILVNPTYYGAMAYGRRKTKGDTSVPMPGSSHIIVDNAFPAIVSKDTCQLVQGKIKEMTKYAPAAKGSSYLLSGMITCGLCGSRFR